MSKFIVVYGSAVRPGATPRDIDVLYWGVPQEEVETVVRDWARERGLPDGLPLDMRKEALMYGAGQSGRTRVVNVPVPVGVPLAYEVVEGDFPVRAEVVRNLTSILRLAEFNQEEALDQLKLIEWAQYGRFGLLDGAEEDIPRGVYLGQGALAYANALRHAPDSFLSRLGDRGQFLIWVKSFGPVWSRVLQGTWLHVLGEAYGNHGDPSMGEDGLLYGGTKEVILPYGQIPHLLTPAQREDVPSILRMLAETSESKDWQSLRTIANVLEGRTPVDKAFGLIRREATYQVQSMARYMLENPQKELCKFLISTRQVSLLATYKG